jgi:hypothetical protein
MLIRGTCFFFVVVSLSTILSSCATPQPGSSGGRPRYELLGLLNEYGGRPLSDPFLVEDFYGSEKAAANRFEKVLREFCADESLPQNWLRVKEKKEQGGGILFGSKEITASINTSYSVSPHGGFLGERVGVLSKSTLRSASRADMLRYVAGAYIRYGDLNSAHRALFSMANNYRKMCVVVYFLQRLGCSDIRFYVADTIPAGLVLTFSPSAEVKAVTGIRREIRPDELKALFPFGPKEEKLPHL